MQQRTYLFGSVAVLVCAFVLPAALWAQAATPATGQKPKSPVSKALKDRAAKKAARPTPAKELFGAAKMPAPMRPRAIGFYAKGCLAGGEALPIDGPAWQAMRLSRNRNWAHPELVALVKRLALEAKERDGWQGLLVGDLSQPRGGPMLTGHASHQVGLDADIWFTPMPDHRLTVKEREEFAATSMLAADRVSVDPKIWTEAHYRLLKRAASYLEVQRVLVNPAIKKAVCEAAKDEKDRGWLAKIRPIWGHYYHFHIRMACPKGSSNCESQPAPGPDDGCGAELQRWLALVKNPPKPGPIVERPPITLSQLPADCRSVLESDTATAPMAATAKSVKPAAPLATKKATITK